MKEIAWLNPSLMEDTIFPIVPLMPLQILLNTVVTVFLMLFTTEDTVLLIPFHTVVIVDFMALLTNLKEKEADA